MFGTSNTMNGLVSSITSNPFTTEQLRQRGLNATKVTWEDTARSKNSCFGPNISDMTLVCEDALMPVIRKPNFSDVTVDIPLDSFNITVGNESGSSLKTITLREYLKDISVYTDNTHKTNLLDETNDKDVLTSTQCCVLPCDKGNVDFNVQLFNYQSIDEDPAVLVILVSKNGTSAQILESSNQKLYFNDNGVAKNFNIERLQMNRERKTGVKQEKVKSFTEMKEDEKLENVIMMIQIPLERRTKPSRGFSTMYGGSIGGGGLMQAQAASYNMYDDCELECCEPMLYANSNQSFQLKKSKSRMTQREIDSSMGMDMGIISTGASNGRFIGTKNLELKRDTRFPIRCTFQYYRVTDRDHLEESDIVDIAKQLETAYDFVTTDKKGSLVVDHINRTTEPTLSQPKPTDNPFQKFGVQPKMPANNINTKFAPFL